MEPMARRVYNQRWSPGVGYVVPVKPIWSTYSERPRFDVPMWEPNFKRFAHGYVNYVRPRPVYK